MAKEETWESRILNVLVSTNPRYLVLEGLDSHRKNVMRDLSSRKRAGAPLIDCGRFLSQTTRRTPVEPQR